MVRITGDDDEHPENQARIGAQWTFFQNYRTVNDVGRIVGEDLTAEYLCAHGFKLVARWMLHETGIKLDTKVEFGKAVYAFAVDGIVKYVGTSSRNLHERLGSHTKLKDSSNASGTIRTRIRKAIEEGSVVEILSSSPGDSEWNDLPVDQVAGLELGLIHRWKPSWNKHGTSLRYVTVHDI